jgi:hypothetical protein
MVEAPPRVQPREASLRQYGSKLGRESRCVGAVVKRPPVVLTAGQERADPLLHLRLPLSVVKLGYAYPEVDREPHVGSAPHAVA